MDARTAEARCSAVATHAFGFFLSFAVVVAMVEMVWDVDAMTAQALFGFFLFLHAVATVLVTMVVAVAASSS